MRFSLGSMFWAAALVGLALTWWQDHTNLADQLHWSRQSLRVSKLRVDELERAFLKPPPSQKMMVQPPRSAPFRPQQPKWIGTGCQFVGVPLAAAPP